MHGEEETYKYMGILETDNQTSGDEGKIKKNPNIFGERENYPKLN